MKPRATQAEIARRVGVTQATVSLVLGSKEPSSRVGAELREKILGVANELGYRPHAGARLMRGKGADIVGILLRSLAAPFNSVLAQELEQRLAARGYTVFIGQTHRDPERITRYAEEFVRRGADGLVCLDQVVWAQPALIRKVRAELRAAVFMGAGNVAGLHTVDVDRAGAARLAVSHLLERGCRRIALATWAARDGFAAGVEARRAGYRAALEAAGLAYDPALVFKCRAEPVPGGLPDDTLAQAVWEEVIRPRRADGVLGYDDNWALRLARVIRHEGRTVPDDIAVAGLGNQPAAALGSPSITTVDFQLDAVAARLVELLVAQIEGRSVPRGERATLVPARLVLRESA